MLRKIMIPGALVLALLGAGAAVAAGSDPTIQQIYQAAQGGNMAAAEQMVSQVLQDHPRSGRAHYVAAEVYARTGDFSTARRELSEAESLEPGLPFARRQSVAALESELSQGRFVQRVQRVPYTPFAASARTHRSSSRAWSLLLVLIAGLVIVWALMRRRRAQMMGYPQQYPGQPGMPPTGMGPMGMGGVGPPYPGYGPGMRGPGLMGSIGTGLAMGAGMAAGEALVDRMVGPHTGGVIPDANVQGAGPPVNGDMGGQDFGVSDGSWDGGSGGSDPAGGDMGGGDLGAGGDLGGGANFGAGGDGWT
ncbi:MAG: tetratricopeptide repeat protein [Steroidobacteraceae bacterium]